uniref:NADPH-quinone reductase (Modulator of drug activity B) n=1 Tax=Candidatus Kentrum sp. FW TaxID=2126338 RepID=A0A450SJD4_9GAMM|nr:MAG: Putative NADPH-quinone reductase (modulator of drug activity B) [Candidatus Kentron sp. FW]
MEIIVVLAHPNNKSFNHAIAGKVVSTLKENGHSVIFHDLYEEQFDPIMTTPELEREYELPPGIRPYCEEIKRADGMIFVHPNWFGQFPAILKGWVDRVFIPGVVHSVPEKDSIVTEGLLRQMTAIAIVTSHVPMEQELKEFGNPLETIWKNCIFGFCAVRDASFVFLTSVFESTSDQRVGWLAEIEELVRSKFPRAHSRI